MSFDSIRPSNPLHQIKHDHRAKQMVDFLSDEQREEKKEKNYYFEQPQEKKWHWFNTAILIVIIIVLGIGLVTADNLSNRQPWLDKFNPLRILAGWLSGAGSDDKMTILALGIGGPGHDGPYLTDTIIVLSLDLKNKHAIMLSLPRDMVVKNKQNQWVRINSVYSQGRGVNPEQGISDISQTIENITGLNIDYYALINFKGFVDFVDGLGGVDINVEKSFIDNAFPADDKGNTTVVSFSAGQQTMNGVSALSYARSRHGTNGEGSDFARSHRQQIIISAIKDKVLGLNIFNDFDKIERLFSIVKNNFDSNASVNVVYKIAKMLIDFDKNNIHNFVITDGPGGLLIDATTPEGAMILEPKDGTYETLKRMVSYLSVIDAVKEEKQKIAILNGTDAVNLAAQTTELFTNIGFNVGYYGNAQVDGFANSVVYKISPTEKSVSINVLKKELQAVVTDNQPDWLKKWLTIHNDQTYDMVAVIGNNYASKTINTAPLPFVANPIEATSTPTNTPTTTLNLINGAGGDDAISSNDRILLPTSTPKK